jgi:hypothetical protein
MDFLQAAAIALISGGLVSLIEFLIRRSDEKQDKNSEVLKALKELADEIASILARMDKENADDARRNILNFDDELRRKVDHSEESYNQVLADIKFYRHYCREHEDYENDKATSAITHVRETYQEVKNANKFI